LGFELLRKLARLKKLELPADENPLSALVPNG